MQYNADPSTQKDFSANVFNGSDNLPRFNLSTELLTDVIKSSTIFSFKSKSSRNVKDFDRTLLSGTIDTCKVSKGVIGNFIVRMIVDQLGKSSNFRFICPQSKGYYYVRNLGFDVGFFPSFLIANNLQWEMNLLVRLKTPTSKRFVNTFNLKIIGSFDE